MNWLFSKQKKTDTAGKPKASIESIRSKLASYQPSTTRSVFEGPSLRDPDSDFEFEKVHFDPDASGIQQAAPFSC